MSHTLYSPEVNNGAVTSFIPLTTTWTASKGCSSSFRLNGPSLVAFDPGYGLDVDSNVVCAPPAVTKWWEHGHLDDNDGSEAKVSIGPLTCPYGFYTVASSTKDATSTLAMCCPEDYYLQNGSPGEIKGECLSDISSGMTLIYASTPVGESSSWAMATSTVSSSGVVGAIAVVGWNIRAALPTSTTMSAPTSSKSQTVSANTGTGAATTVTASDPASASSLVAEGDARTTDATTSTAMTDPTSITTGAGARVTSVTGSTTTINPTPDSGLMAESKAGIGIGVGVGAIGVIALLVGLYFYRHRREQTMPKDPAPCLHTSYPSQPYMSKAAWPSELPDSKYQSWGGRGRLVPVELEGGH